MWKFCPIQEGLQEKITKAQDYVRSANKKGARSGKPLKQIESEKVASSAGPGQTVKTNYKTPKFSKSKVLLSKLKERFGHSRLAAPAANAIVAGLASKRLVDRLRKKNN